MSALDDGKDRFRQDALHTFESTTRDGGVCRVCRGEIGPGEPALRRQHFLEIAHPACGWLRLPEEHDPHEVRRPGTDFVFWEWRCPYCGRDACHTRRPRDGDDPRCKRCHPRRLAPGCTAETINFMRVTPPKRKRWIVIPIGERVKVVELEETRALIEVRGIRAWAFRHSLSPV